MTDKDKKEDRRVLRTRRLLRDALVTLILEKRYDKITVQDIIDRADVGRSTFYAHFQDKEDLLISGFTDVTDELGQHIEDAHHTQEGEKHVAHSLVFFQHAQKNHRLYKAMLDGGGGDLLLALGQEHIQLNVQTHLNELFPDGREPIVPIPVISSYLAGALLSVLVWWLNEGRPYSPEQVNKMFQTLTMSGVTAVFDDSPNELSQLNR